MAKQRKPNTRLPPTGRGEVVPWVNELRRLRDDLQSLRKDNESHDHFHHAVVATEQSFRDVNGLPIIPKFPAFYGVVLERFEFPVDGRFHTHFVFDEDNTSESRDLFRKFQAKLTGVRNKLKSVPRALVPLFNVPELTTGSLQSLVAWISFLHWFAANTNQTIVESYVVFDSDATQRPEGKNLREWEMYSKSDDFDPRPGLIHTTADIPTNSAISIPRPSLYGIYLSKPLLYVSVNALNHFLLLQDSRNAEKLMAKARQERTGISYAETRVLMHLYSHHCLEESTQKLSEPKLVGLTELNLSAVHRSIQSLFAHKQNTTKKRYLDLFRSNEVGKAVKELYEAFFGSDTDKRGGEPTVSNTEYKKSGYRHNGQSIPDRGSE